MAPATDVLVWFERCIAQAPPRLVDKPVKDWPSAIGCSTAAVSFCRFVDAPAACLDTLDAELTTRSENLRSDLPATADASLPTTTDDATLARYLAQKGLGVFLEYEEAGSFRPPAPIWMREEMGWLGEKGEAHFSSQVMRHSMLVSLHEEFQALTEQ